MSKKDDKDLTQSLFDPSVIAGAERPNASVEIFDKVTDEIFSKKSIELKTDLNERQLWAFSSARVFARKYKRRLLGSLVKQYSLYAVSRNRKGRKEFENIAKANLGMNAEPEESHSIPRRLLGKN